MLDQISLSLVKISRNIEHSQFGGLEVYRKHTQHKILSFCVVGLHSGSS